MKILTPLLCMATLLVAGTSTVYAQKRKLTLAEATDYRSEIISKRMPNISRWADDDHYLQNNSPGTPLLMVSVKTGEATHYPFPTHLRYRDDEPDKENMLYSPDSTWIAYTENNNLYAQELASGRIVQYTTDGSDTVLNGKPSWVYYEEILGHSTQTFWWSPDGKYLGFYRTDESQIPQYPIFNNLSHSRAGGMYDRNKKPESYPQEIAGQLTQTRYPQAGEANPQVRIGIVPVEGGAITWADFPEADQYFGNAWWAPDGKFWVQWMPRRQNELKIFAIDPVTGTKSEVYTEQHTTWVNWKKELTFLKKRPEYLVQNTNDGWDQIYLYNLNGTLKKQLTKGKKFWKTQILYVDEAKQKLFFTSYGEHSTRNDLYSVKLDGTSLKRLTFGNYNHQVSLSPTGKYFVTSYSNTSTPGRIALVDAQTGKVIRELFDSKAPTFDSIEQRKVELVEYTTADGFKIPALIMTPPELDPTRKYPVIIYTYGGPNSPVVNDQWIEGGSWYESQGIIRVALDHRGSGHCGREGLDCLYRNLGKYEIADFTDFINQHLYTRPYVDRTRIGIEGHSYGGYMTALAVTKASDYFKFGIADAGVMDWRLYDSHYTERYMDTPANNPEGYKESSVLNYIDNYQADNLLFIRHGLIDDNVHPQNSLLLVQLLEQSQKPFQLMVYPECTHSFMGRSYKATRNDAVTFWHRVLLHKTVPEELLQK